MPQRTRLQIISEAPTPLVTQTQRAFRVHLAHCVGGNMQHVLPLVLAIVQHLGAERHAVRSSGQHIQAMIGRGTELLADLGHLAHHIDRIETEQQARSPDLRLKADRAHDQSVPAADQSVPAADQSVPAADQSVPAADGTLSAYLLSAAIGSLVIPPLPPILWGSAARRWQWALPCAVLAWLACPPHPTHALLLLGGLLERLARGAPWDTIRTSLEGILVGGALLWYDEGALAQLCLVAFGLM
jgi:hypothetical protein